MELAETILNVIAEVTENTSQSIISKSRQEDIVFARKIFVNFCLKYGFSTSFLSKFLHRSKEGIRNIYISSISEENRKLYTYYYKRIDTKLKEMKVVE